MVPTAAFQWTQRPCASTTTTPRRHRAHTPTSQTLWSTSSQGCPSWNAWHSVSEALPPHASSTCSRSSSGSENLSSPIGQTKLNSLCTSIRCCALNYASVNSSLIFLFLSFFFGYLTTGYLQTDSIWLPTRHSHVDLASCPSIRDTSHLPTTPPPQLYGLRDVTLLPTANNSHILRHTDAKSRSERLAVTLAYALPALEDLSLTRITRSAMHAHDLLYDSPSLQPYPSAYPNTYPTSNPYISPEDDNMFTSPSTLSYSYSTVPTVMHDDDVPEHPVLGTELRLPMLLRLNKLRRLKIRDTHMGDPMWCAENGEREGSAHLAPLEVLDLGSCAHESPAVNEQCTARILRRVPSTIKSFSLSTALPDVTAQLPSKAEEASDQQESMDCDDATTPTVAAHPVLPHLRTLHLTPLVPIAALQTTLSQPTLAESPVHTLSVAFHPDDAGEGCEALAAFLGERGFGGASIPIASSSSHPCGPARYQIHQRRRSASLANVLSSTPTKRSPLTRQNSTLDSTTASRRLLYPSLRTLQVDLASMETDTDVAEFSPCLSASPSMYTPSTRNARALARAKAAEERKMEAVRRLKGVCKDLGIEAVVKGLNGMQVDVSEVEEVSGAGAVRMAASRSRSNST